MNNYNKQKIYFHIASLFFLSLLTWSGVIHNYLLIDHDVSVYFYSGYNSGFGIWRLIGHNLAVLILSFKLFPVGLILILTHFISSSLLFIACLIVWREFKLAALLSLFYCIYPWGYGLMTAGVMIQVIVEPIFLWIFVIWIVQRFRFPEKIVVYEFPVMILFVLISLSVQERLSFCYPCISAWGFFIILSDNISSKKQINSRHLLLFTAPAIGFLIYSFLYFFTKDNSNVNPLAFHLPALLSTFYHQYNHYQHFVPLFCLDGWSYMFYDWNAINFTVAFLSFVLGLYFQIKSIKENKYYDFCHSENNLSNLQSSALIIALVLGSAMVFVFSGGYSNEIYKRYSIATVLIFSFCGTLSLLPNIKSIFSIILSPVCLSIIALFFVMASWIHAGVWRYDVKSIHALVNDIHLNKKPFPTELIWEKDTRKFWPHLNTMTEAMRRNKNVLDDSIDLYKFKFKINPITESDLSKTNILGVYKSDEKWQFIVH